MLLLPVGSDKLGTNEAFFEEASRLVVELLADFFTNATPCFGTSFDCGREDDFFFDGKIVGKAWLALGMFLFAKRCEVFIHRCDRDAGGLFGLSRDLLFSEAFQ